MNPTRIRYFHHFKGLTYPGPWRERLLEIVHPDTEVEFVQPGDHAFIEFVEDVYHAELMGVQFANDARLTCLAGEADIICHSCGAEPGVRAARELCNVPVMGPACAAMHVASMLGRRFSYVIAGADGDSRHCREFILSCAEHYGLAAKLVSIRAVDASPLDFKEDVVDKRTFARLKEQTLREARAAVDEDGAEVLVGYGGPAMHDWLSDNLAAVGVPVVSPDLALIAMSELLVKLKLSQSNRTYPTPRKVYDISLEGAATIDKPDRPSREITR